LRRAEFALRYFLSLQILWESDVQRVRSFTGVRRQPQKRPLLLWLPLWHLKLSAIVSLVLVKIEPDEKLREGNIAVLLLSS
jgi:hypothetical protein